MATGLKFDLADGRRWLIRPLDRRAAAVVAELGRVMRLKPGATGRELLVAVPGGDDWYPAAGLETGGPVTCCVAEPSNPDRLATGMDRVAFLVAMDALARGGLLLHAALAEHRGRGFLMAGPGTVGKSTASRRLPPPWSSLCDDTTLVVRDRAGRFWAHPWPTWSTFHIAGPADRSWEVERAVPLRAVFFISQAPADRLEPVTPTQATALTIESAVEVSREACRLADRRAARRLCDAAAGAARHLAATVPCHKLEISLDGRFWQQIERVLPVREGQPQDAPVLGPNRAGDHLAENEPLAANRPLRVVYTGTSMNPTLVEPELLEVVPGPVRPGDVACFRPPGQDRLVIHRVAAAGPGGIRTRGDSCSGNDDWVLGQDDIIGRIAAARRGNRLRAIAGGRAGLAVARRIRLGRFLRRCAGLVPHRLYCLLSRLGPFDRLLPGRFRPRLVSFDVRGLKRLKLLAGRREIGRYSFRDRRWTIRRPFRLLVDERALAGADTLFRAGEKRD